MTAERADKLASKLVALVVDMHEDSGTARPRWDSACGRALVYGLERTLGFIEAAELEAVIERAWRSKADLRDAILTYLTAEYVNA